MSLRSFKTILQRRQFMTKLKNLNLEAIGVYPSSLEQAAYTNCENMFGAIQIPLGIAGPLKVNGNYAKSSYYIPLATTEGALVASVNRGCKAVTESGGVVTLVENIGITRGPVFQTKSLKDSHMLKMWLEKNFLKLSQIAQKTSTHLSLTKIMTNFIGKYTYVRLYFYTEDAMGMNMATFASQEIVSYIEKNTKVYCTSLAGNFDIDKKAAYLNFILGRGKRVWAETVVKKSIVEKTLKTTPEKIHQVCLQKCLLGSALSGSLGYNAHFANTIAAIFLACGQDPGHIVEGSLGITSTDIINDDLYLTVYLPNLVIGTVGGGTKLPAQKEALEILGVNKGSDGSRTLEFAEIIAGVVIAGELSLLASLAVGSLAKAHHLLTRIRK